MRFSSSHLSIREGVTRTPPMAAQPIASMDGRGPPEGPSACPGPSPDDGARHLAVTGSVLFRWWSGLEDQVPCSHWFTRSWLAAIHLSAASGPAMPSFAMYSATWFWSSLVQWKFLISVTAGEPELANFVEISLFRWYGG